MGHFTVRATSRPRPTSDSVTGRSTSELPPESRPVTRTTNTFTSRVRLLSALILLPLGSTGLLPAQVAGSAASTGWRVASEPSVRIGTSGDRPGHDLLGVVGASRLTDGSIAVATAGTSGLRFYAPDGTWRTTAGRPGDGPGEFRRLEAMVPYRGDSLAAWDGRLVRITLFDSRGRPGRSISVGEPYLTLHGATSDGSFVLHRPEQVALDAESGLRDVAIEVFRLGPDGSPGSSLGRVLGRRTWVGEVVGLMSTTDQPLGPSSRVAAARTDVWIANAGTGRIARSGPGGRLLSIAREASTGPITARHLRAAKARYAATLAEYPADIADGLLAGFDRIDRPATLPPFGQVVADREGYVWVQHGDPERAREWEVFDRDGGRVTSVGFPALDRVLEIGRDYLLGTWTDALDVEYVGLFSVSRG